MKLNFKFLLGSMLALVVLFSACSSDDDDDRSSDKKILEFKIGAVVGQISEQDKTIDIKLTSGTDLTQLKPIVIISDKATVSPASGATVDFSKNDVEYTVTAEDGSKQIYSVNLESVKDSDAQIVGFEFEGLVAEATINEVEKIITIAVPYDTDLAKLEPKISILGEKVATKSGDKPNFTAPEVYVVTAKDGTEVQYTVTVTVAKFEMSITGINVEEVVIGEKFVISGVFIAKGNEAFLTRGEDKLELVVLEESATSITVATMIGTEGNYKLSMKNGDVMAEHAKDVKVVTPTPSITKLDAAKYEQGKGNIVVTGKNLKGTAVEVFFKMDGENANYGSKQLDANINATEITVANFSTLKIGKQSLYFEIDGKKTESLSFEIEASKQPVPTITGLSSLTPEYDEVITVTGTNFSTMEDTRIEIYEWVSYLDSWEYFADLKPKSVTATSLTFVLNSFSGDKVKVKVKVNGQTSAYSQEMNVK